MREIVLDTETTGLDPSSGDRIVEIGAIELFNHMPTGQAFHKYLNPERKMPQEAFAVHGLSDEFLKDKPKFKNIVKELKDFIGKSKMIIHNASFDMKFINAELINAGSDPYPLGQAVDTLALARKKFPGAQNSLDALCRRFNVDNSSREKHSALLDSELLSGVYLELIGGRQPIFSLDQPNSVLKKNKVFHTTKSKYNRNRSLKPNITLEEENAHDVFVESLGKESMWKKLYN